MHQVQNSTVHQYSVPGMLSRLHSFWNMILAPSKRRRTMHKRPQTTRDCLDSLLFTGVAH